MLEDHYSIETPEGLRLDLVLAGVGTRIVAAIIDTAAIGTIMFVVAVGAAFLAPLFDGNLEEGGFVLFAVVIAFLTTIPLAYYVLFETLDGGRSIGKRAFQLRVVHANGLPVGFTGSLVRNLLRLVDLLPAAYLIGLVAVVASRANQRVGDLAAGTLVVRERAPETITTWTPAGAVTGPRWDVSGVGVDHVQAIRYFLERRATLTHEQQLLFAKQIADPIRQLVGTAGELRTDLEFLEKVWMSKEAYR